MEIRDIVTWNKAAIGKYVLAIAMKKDYLFVKWIHSIYLMNCDLWSYKIAVGGSWYWRRLMAVKNCIKKKITESNFLTEVYTIKKGCSLLNEQIQEDNAGWDKVVWKRMTLQNIEL